MDTILFLDACIRENSRTRYLAQTVLARMAGNVETLIFEKEDLRPLDRAALQKRDAAEWDDPLFRYARQFARADVIVLAAPYWDLLFPATVRLYFEAVTVAGLTFRYTPQGIPEGLCRAKKLIYVSTAGGYVPEHRGFAYVKALAEGFFGIPETHLLLAQGLDIDGADVGTILHDAKDAAGMLI